MSWDERLFGWLWRRGKALSRTREAPELSARRAHLPEQIDSLTVLAAAIAGEPVRVLETQSSGGAAAGVLWLPAHLDVLAAREDNERAYVLRAALGAIAMRRRL
ncbi:MAG: hypothetical protein J0L92_35920, partial [Deltaproteobacteria bacterium]|nr:hypothetical protein [Deltaproteobacteria bacterium]